MQVTFLGHSGFCLELENIVLIFDWWQGELPPLPTGKPLAVFASHSHQDHFKPEIFALDDGTRSVRFLLGNDIKLSRRHKEVWQLTEETVSHCQRLHGGETAEPFPGLHVETLPSTDAGVAWVVTAENRTIYHAGDLNWWHWEGETALWNRNMERDYKRFLEPLRGRKIDLAMVPLDPRLGEAEDLGLLYFLSLTDARQVLPMHQWGDTTPTDRFLRHHPEYAGVICRASLCPTTRSSPLPPR